MTNELILHRFMNRERSVLILQCAVLAIVVSVAAFNLTTKQDSCFEVWFGLLTSSLTLIVPFPLNVNQQPR